MAAVSTYLSDKMLDHIRGVSSYTMPTVWMGLSTTTSSAGTPGTEAAYTGYARVATAGLLSAASAGSGTNSSAIPFPACTGGTSTIVGFYTWDASTGGNMLEFGSASLSVSTGIVPSFPVSSFVTTLV